MMKTLFTTICWLLAFTLNAQVSINTNGAAPASNTMLDIKSNNKGVQFPRMTSAERMAIAVTPADAGLMVYDMTNQALYMYDGTQWFPFAFAGTSQEVRLQPYSGISNNGSMGASCSISGDYAVVGAPYDSVGNLVYCGSAVVFKKQNTGWIQMARLIAPDAKSWDMFGISVSIEGDNIIIGSSSSFVGTTSQGAAYYFTRSGETWNLQQKIFANDGEFGADFGNTVKLQGSYLYIGSKDKKVGNNSEQGIVYVLNKIGNSWSHLTQLKANDGSPQDYYGSSIAVNENTVVIGAPKDDDTKTNQGSAYVYTRNGNTFTFQKKLFVAGLQEYSDLGTDVSIEGDIIACGAPGADFSPDRKRGAVVIYKRIGTEWTQFTILYTNGFSETMSFGAAVKLKGGYLFVGAPYDAVNGLQFAGSLHIFKLNLNFSPGLVKRMTDPIGLDADYFSSAFDVQDETIIIGAKGANVNGPANGNAGRIFFGKWQ